MSGVIRTVAGMCVIVVFAMVERSRFAMMMLAIENVVLSFVTEQVLGRFIEETEPAACAGLDLTRPRRVHIDVTSAHICVIHVG
jgi:hypothetical protein